MSKSSAWGILSLCAVLAGAPALAAAPPAASALAGHYTLDAGASDNIDHAVEGAIAKMNFVLRTFAKGRLSNTNQPYKKLEIAFKGDDVVTVMDGRKPIVSPANGTPVKWKREDGEVFDVSTALKGGQLQQVFVSPDGQRTNLYALGEDGHSLTMTVVVTSPKLPDPLRYKLAYDRAK